MDKESLEIKNEMLEEWWKFIIDYYENKEGKELPIDEKEFYKRYELFPPIS